VTLPANMAMSDLNSLNVTKFHSNSFKKSVGTKKTTKGGGRQTPSPACLGLTL